MTTHKNDLTVEQIRELAKITSEDLGLWELGYSRAAVEKVEDFVERERMNWGQETRGSWANRLGAFLGECLLETLEGQWQWHEALHTWGILFQSGLWAFPFSKIHKQLEEGSSSGESILHFFDSAVAYAPSGKLP